MTLTLISSIAFLLTVFILLKKIKKQSLKNPPKNTKISNTDSVLSPESIVHIDKILQKSTKNKRKYNKKNHPNKMDAKKSK